MSTDTMIFIIMCVFSFYMGYRVGKEISAAAAEIVFFKLKDKLITHGYLNKDEFQKVFIECAKSLVEDNSKSDKKT